jgi:hypothetical protein
MRRILVIVAAAAFIGATPAVYAQETGAGTDRFEVTGFPVGGVFFSKLSDNKQPDFGNYALGAALTYKMNRWLAVEGEVGNAIGVRQDFSLNDTSFANQKTPCMFAYSGNLVFSPMTNGRGLVPYAAGGLGGLRLMNTSDTANIGVTKNVNYLTGNVGGGLKWFATRHWGVRGDYRLLVVRDTTQAPAFFGQDELRYGHRVYGGLLFTY